MHRARPPTGATPAAIVRPAHAPYTLPVEPTSPNQTEAPAASPPTSPTAELHPIEAAARQRAVLLRFVRAGFFILLVTVAILNAASSTAKVGIVWWVPVLVAVILLGAAFVADFSTPNKKISAISGAFLGILAGMLATLALTLVMDLLLQALVQDPKVLEALAPFVSLLKVMLGITLCYLGITTVLQTQDDFRLVIPYVEFAKQIRGPQPLVLDSSALIDARIVDLCQTGIIQTPVLVPRFVIGELQTLADSADKLKRAKGRRGLEIIARIQRLAALDLTIDETVVPGKAVDQMLVELARMTPATIVTTDSALNRVAAIHGVKVLNLNDVANALKPSLVPGEQLTLTLIKPGEQPGQGVGYLDDGTMVVAEDGAGHVGEQVTLAVTSSLQTSAGRLIFGRLAGESVPEADGHGLAGSEPASSPGTHEAAGPEPARVARSPFPPNPPRRPNPARNPRR